MNLYTQVSDAVARAVLELFEQSIAVQLSIPNEQFGDFATNVAMQLAGNLGGSPREIAELLAGKLSEAGLASTVAGPGFINIRVSDEVLAQQSSVRDVQLYGGESVVVEYSCPNYFKELHAGHLYQTIVGDAVAKLVERAGATVHRTNFGGDVGLHAAKTLWAVLGGTNIEAQSDGDSSTLTEIKNMANTPLHSRAQYISSRYTAGSGEYEQNEQAQREINDINKRIYELHKSGDTVSDFAQIYFTCRAWSREYFESFYSELRLHRQSDGAHFTYYPESATEGIGMKTVMEYVEKGVFKHSEGAIVFEGEPFGLHTRVFVTKQGLPTYEAKDIGVMLLEQNDFAFDKRILVTGTDQLVYMKVVWKAFEQIQPGSEAKMTHLTNGTIRFGDGKKMSSRLGNVTRAVDVLTTVRELVGHSEDPERDERIALGAVKYEFLKHKLGGDFAFDPEESVSLQGNSGPYLQYALVRAKSILSKVATKPDGVYEHAFNPSERTLVRKLSEYATVVEKATHELMPHLVCTYLYELAQEFNRFYEQNLVIGSDKELERLQLVAEYAATLTHGLDLLGIEAPEKM